MIVYFIAALAIFVQKTDTNRAAVFLFAVFYSINEIMLLDKSADYFLWSIMSSTAFVYLLSKLSRVTIMILLLALTDIILSSIDLIALVAYNLDNERVFQFRGIAEPYISTFQIAALLVTDARIVDSTAIRYNLSMLLNHASRFFVRSKKVYSREK